MLGRPFIVAGELFEWAAKQGFIGVAVYIACWVFMFPVMIGICVVLGVMGSWGEREAQAQAKKNHSQMIKDFGPNAPVNDKQKKDWEKADRKYEEHLREQREKKLDLER